MTLAGLVLLGRGVLWAAPPVFFYTPEEYARWSQGRLLMIAATMVLLLASGLFGLQGRVASGERVDELVRQPPTATTATPARRASAR